MSEISVASSKQLRQRSVISALVANNGSVPAARRASGIPARTLRRWFSKDPEFQESIAEHVGEMERTLLEEAMRRALLGSDSLLKFLLKAVNPDRYQRYSTQPNTQVTYLNGSELQVLENEIRSIDPTLRDDIED